MILGGFSVFLIVNWCLPGVSRITPWTSLQRRIRKIPCLRLSSHLSFYDNCQLSFHRCHRTRIIGNIARHLRKEVKHSQIPLDPHSFEIRYASFLLKFLSPFLDSMLIKKPFARPAIFKRRNPPFPRRREIIFKFF